LKDEDARAPGCDLCGSAQQADLVHLRTGRALRSDRVLIDADLHKRICAGCGLVQGGHIPGDAELAQYYESTYTAGVDSGEYTFYTPSGPVSRSHLFADWMIATAGLDRWRAAERVLEVGAGAGHLLAEMGRRFPEADIRAVEPRAARGPAAGSTDIHRGVLDAGEEAFDIVYAIAVIEHVGSPAAFLKSLRRKLRQGGILILCQPTQDVASYDVFFVDHLYHFGSEHLAAYARQHGFSELARQVGHPWMPNFSLHCWEAVPLAPPAAWHGPPLRTTCAATVQRVLQDMEALDDTLRRLSGEGAPVAAFGLNEVFSLACAYSGLGKFPLAAGLADNPVPAACMPSLPVATPEAAAAEGIRDALLTMNRVYYPQARERLAALGIRAHPVLS
jgi:SAM-dependent methyltransferase